MASSYSQQTSRGKDIKLKQHLRRQLRETGARQSLPWYVAFYKAVHNMLSFDQRQNKGEPYIFNEDLATRLHELHSLDSEAGRGRYKHVTSCSTNRFVSVKYSRHLYLLSIKDAVSRSLVERRKKREVVFFYLYKLNLPFERGKTWKHFFCLEHGESVFRIKKKTI